MEVAPLPNYVPSLHFTREPHAGWRVGFKKVKS